MATWRAPRQSRWQAARLCRLRSRLCLSVGGRDTLRTVSATPPVTALRNATHCMPALRATLHSAGNPESLRRVLTRENLQQVPAPVAPGPVGSKVPAMRYACGSGRPGATAELSLEARCQEGVREDKQTPQAGQAGLTTPWRRDRDSGGQRIEQKRTALRGTTAWPTSDSEEPSALFSAVSRPTPFFRSSTSALQRDRRTAALRLSSTISRL